MENIFMFQCHSNFSHGSSLIKVRFNCMHNVELGQCQNGLLLLLSKLKLFPTTNVCFQPRILCRQTNISIIFVSTCFCPKLGAKAFDLKLIRTSSDYINNRLKFVLLLVFCFCCQLKALSSWFNQIKLLYVDEMRRTFLASKLNSHFLSSPPHREKIKLLSVAKISRQCNLRSEKSH